MISSLFMHLIAKYLSFEGKCAKKTLPKVPLSMNLRISKSSSVTLSELDPVPPECFDSSLEFFEILLTKIALDLRSLEEALSSKSFLIRFSSIPLIFV